MDKTLGRKVYYGICVCLDCGKINNVKYFKRREKRREKRAWQNEMRNM